MTDINVSKRIVIVEDDVSIQLMYKFRFEAANYQVRTASDGKEGLIVIEAFTPDIILVDLRMPKMDGSEMLQQLRATAWGADIRAIVLTNLSKSEAPQSLRFMNIDRYIIKAHHTPKQVTEIVNEVLALND